MKIAIHNSQVGFHPRWRSYCEEKNIQWFASAWDVPSLHFLDSYNYQRPMITLHMVVRWITCARLSECLWSTCQISDIIDY